MRHALAARAGAEQLVDVAFERHDSPLGTLLVGATAEGLVRVALPSEQEDEVLQQLAGPDLAARAARTPGLADAGAPRAR